jgi:hypothetical protein
MKNIKKRIALFFIILLVGFLLSLSYHDRYGKYQDLNCSGGHFLDSDVENFYCMNGYFPYSCSQLYKDDVIWRNSITFRKSLFASDPFTEEPYKFILVKSDIKEKNGILILSAGYNGVYDNKEREVAIEDFHKLSLMNKEINKEMPKPSFLECFMSDTDIVVHYWCDEFQYLEGIGQVRRGTEQERLKKLRDRRRRVRLYVRGRLESIDISNNSLELSIDGIKTNFYKVVNIEAASVGDSISVSAMFNPFIKEEFSKCKIYHFELNRPNVMYYMNTVLKDIGLSYGIPKGYELEGPL